MANEAKVVELINKGDIIDFTVADGTKIEKGTVMALADPRTALASSGADIFAGIAASDKKADNGQTNLGCYTSGIFTMTPVSGAGIVAGNIVKLSGANVIAPATGAEIAAGQGFGKALEDQSGSTPIEVKLNFM